MGPPGQTPSHHPPTATGYVFAIFPMTNKMFWSACGIFSRDATTFWFSFSPWNFADARLWGGTHARLETGCEAGAFVEAGTPPSLGSLLPALPSFFGRPFGATNDGFRNSVSISPKGFFVLTAAPIALKATDRVA